MLSFVSLRNLSLSSLVQFLFLPVCQRLFTFPTDKVDSTSQPNRKTPRIQPAYSSLTSRSQNENDTMRFVFCRRITKRIVDTNESSDKLPYSIIRYSMHYQPYEIELYLLFREMYISIIYILEYLTQDYFFSGDTSSPNCIFLRQSGFTHSSIPHTTLVSDSQLTFLFARGKLN